MFADRLQTGAGNGFLTGAAALQALTQFRDGLGVNRAHLFFCEHHGTLPAPPVALRARSESRADIRESEGTRRGVQGDKQTGYLVAVPHRPDSSRHISARIVTVTVAEFIRH